MLTIIVLILAGLGAGALNAIAGGGTFLSFPALVWAGVPPIMANATATFAALPGYIGSAWAFRHNIAGQGRPGLKGLILVVVIGGLLGALLLLVTPSDVFSGVVPWLLLVATIAFAIGPMLVRRMIGSGRAMGVGAALALILAVAIYGGYFNGGLGIMLLAAFGIMGMADLNRMNGLKNLLSAVLSLVSVATYTTAGLIDWSNLAVVGLSCLIGGYMGAWAAKRITNVKLLRGFIILVGLVMAAIFYVQT